MVNIKCEDVKFIENISEDNGGALHLDNEFLNVEI